MQAGLVIKQLGVVAVGIVAICTASCQFAGHRATDRNELAMAKLVLADSSVRRGFIVVGEKHGDRSHHVFLRHLLDHLEESSDRLAVGMEMFNHTNQADLDAFLEGSISWRELEGRTDFAQSWGGYTRDYEKILRWCRREGVPVVALNIPRELTRSLALGRPLEKELQSMLPGYPLPEGGYSRFVAIMPAHGAMDESAMLRYYQAQSAWDQVMSSRALGWMAEAGDQATMVILTGRAHADADYAIPFYLSEHGTYPVTVFNPSPREGNEVFMRRK